MLTAIMNKKMNGRFFDGRQVQATLFDGKVSIFRRSDRGGPIAGDDDVEETGDEKKRLDAFASWLEQGGNGNQHVSGQT
jgi:HIV Tat-specific factor 1